MSGGLGDVEHPVEVAAKPALVPAPLDKLDQAKRPEEVQVSLDGADRAVQGGRQGLHLRPAKTGFVVGVVRESAVGRDNFGRDPGVGEVLDLHDPGEFGLRWPPRGDAGS